MKAMPSREPFKAVEQLSACYGRNAQAIRRNLHEFCLNRRRPGFDDETRGIGIEQIERQGYLISPNTSLSCGGTFIGPSAIKSAGTSTVRMKSKKSAQACPPGRVDKTTSPVSGSQVA